MGNVCACMCRKPSVCGGLQLLSAASNMKTAASFRYRDEDQTKRSLQASSLLSALCFLCNVELSASCC